MSADCDIEVLIPTCNRAPALAVTLTALAAQTGPRFLLRISDQSDPGHADGRPYVRPEVQAALRLLRLRGHVVELLEHRPRRGMAEQRDFLLSRVQSPYCLFLDDDVVVEGDLLTRLLDVIRTQGCGFVGSAVLGLSFIDDVRPEQQQIEFWDGPVHAEVVTPDSAAWQRHHVHSAANLLHVQRRLGLTAASQRLYKVAWVGGCVLFDSEKLRQCGGFSFWRQLPPEHCGEDVLAQQRVMARFGGCAIIPSGAYHQELPTTVSQRRIDAPHVLPLDRAQSATELQP